MMVRKLWITILVLLCLPVMALAQEEMPQEVQALLEKDYGVTATSSVGFEMEDGSEVWLLTDGHWLIGYAGRQGEWRQALSALPMSDMRPLHLERVQDELAFEVVSEDGASRLAYRFDGEWFQLAGWRFPDNPAVTRQGELLIYDMGGTQVEIEMPGDIDDLPYELDDLPLTPEDAMERAAISENDAREMFPGYTLRHYAAYNSGTSAEAAYSRVKDGLLFIRRVSFEAGYEPRVTDCGPVPLSKALTARLETEPFESLISCMFGSNTFLTQDAFDRGSLALPADAVILDNQVQEHSVVALVEEDGARYLYVWEIGDGAGANGDGYYARRTQPLPVDASLDLFHAMDGEIQIQWGGQSYAVSFFRNADGQWLLDWFDDYSGTEGVYLGACSFGVWERSGDEEERLRVGTMVGRDLFSVSLDTLDASQPQLDRSGWAVVSNPDPADRLHLRDQADRSSHSQGKFYNGTPVRVLQRGDEWTKVQIGLGSTARVGWMMTEYLAFGDAMNDVRQVFPQLCYRDEYIANDWLNGAYWVAGVEDDEQYILLGFDGEVVYVPQSWLFEGNG